MQNANTYQCPLCLSELVPANSKACDTCKSVFFLADEKHKTSTANDTAKRLPIGPTTV